MSPRNVAFAIVYRLNAPNSSGPEVVRTGSILFTLWLIMFATTSQFIIVGPILPRIAEQLDAPLESLGSLISAYAISLALFTLITGPLSDRFGRWRILFAGTALMSVSLALHAVADNFLTLFLMRLLAGAAGGVLGGAAIAYVGDVFPSERRGWAAGWVMSGFAAGQILGIPIGAITAEQWGYRAPFLIFAAAIGMALLMVRFALPHSTNMHSDKVTIYGALQGYAALLSRRRTAAAAAVYVTILSGMGLLVPYFPTFLENEAGFTGTGVALVFALGGMAHVIVGPRAGKLSDRIGRRPVIVVGSLGAGFFISLTPLAVYAPLAAYPIFVLTLSCVASRASAMQATLTETAPEDQRGRYISLCLALAQLGFGTAAALSGPIYTDFGMTGNALSAASTALIVAVLVKFFLPETLHRVILQSS